jgi:hypothetical protein
MAKRPGADVTLVEIGKLLKEISSLDQRFGIPNEDKVKAWSKVLNPHLNFDTAIDLIAKHYSNSEKTLMPSDLNSYYYGLKKNQTFEAIEQTKVDRDWLKSLFREVRAKTILERGMKYTPGGNPWIYPLGSGKYTAEGLSKGLNLEGGTQIGRSVS